MSKDVKEVYQKNKPLLIYGWEDRRELISSFLLSRGFVNVTIIDSQRELLTKISEYGDVNILLDNKTLYNELLEEKDIITLLTICLNMGNCRIIYFSDLKLDEDVVVKFLYENKKYDIHRYAYCQEEFIEIESGVKVDVANPEVESKNNFLLNEENRQEQDEVIPESNESRYSIIKKPYAEVGAKAAGDVCIDNSNNGGSGDKHNFSGDIEEDGVEDDKYLTKLAMAIVEVGNLAVFKALLNSSGLTIEALTARGTVEDSNIDSVEDTERASITSSETEEDMLNEYLLDSQEFESFYDKYIFFIFLIETVFKESNRTTVNSFLNKYMHEFPNLRNFIGEQNDSLREVMELLDKKNAVNEELTVKIGLNEDKIKELESEIKEKDVKIKIMGESIIELKEFNTELENSVLAATDKLRQGCMDVTQFVSVKSSDYDTFKKIIYFKEVTETKFFSTFILRTMGKLNNKGSKVGCFIFEAPDDYLNKKLSLTGNVQVISNSAENAIYRFEKQIVVLNILNKEVINSILNNSNGYDYIFIIDRLHKNLKLVVGWNCETVYVASKKEDSDVFNIPHDKLITNNLDTALISINKFERYNNLTPLLKERAYKDTVEKFIDKVIITEK